MFQNQCQSKYGYQTTKLINDQYFKKGSSISDESNCIIDQFSNFNGSIYPKPVIKIDVFITKVPGESKNLPKNFGRRFQSLIRHMKNHTEDQQLLYYIESPDVQKFLNFHPEKIGKKQLDKFIKTEAGQVLASDFFGNLRWMSGLVKETKASPEIYFRYNQQYFYEAEKARK